MKIGLEISINVKDIDKERLYEGKKGTYLNLTTFINLDQQDQYGNNGIVKQKTDKDENAELPILGNAKVFWKGEGRQASQQQPVQQSAYGQGVGNKDDFEDSPIPF